MIKKKKKNHLMLRVNLNMKLANGLLHLAEQQGESDQIISFAVCQLVVNLTCFHTTNMIILEVQTWPEHVKIFTILLLELPSFVGQDFYPI